MTNKTINKKGKFIVLEGIDGSGTTTQTTVVASYLFKKGYPVLLTKEPTNLEIGQLIKKKLKEDKQAGLNPFKEKGEEYTRLYIKDRQEHIKKIVIPSLEKGIWVISDRYKYSTFAYQVAQGQNLKELIKKHQDLIVPDLVLILDLSPEEALKRRQKEKTIPELFEELNFQKKVRENYLSLKKELPQEKIKILAADKPLKEVSEQLIKEISNYLLN